MQNFSLKFYDKAWFPVSVGLGTLVGLVEKIQEVEIEKRVNEADQITFSLPRDHSVLDQITVGRIVMVHDGTGQLVSGGHIVGPLNKNQRPFVKVTALGMADLLNWPVSPWKFQLREKDPIGQVNELLWRYRFKRQNTLSDFQNGALSTVDILAIAASTVSTEDNYHVILATVNTTAGGTQVFADQGTFTATSCFLGSPTPIATTMRLRYESIIGSFNDLQVSARTAQGGSGGPTSWSAWSAFQKHASDVDQQELGLFFGNAPTPTWAQFRFRLTTTQTLTSPALNALEVVSTHDFEIKPGTITLPTSHKTYTMDRIPHLRLLHVLADDYQSQFHVTPGMTLNMQSDLGIDRQNFVLLEEGKNFAAVQWELDDETLTNELEVRTGDNKGLSKISISSMATTSQRLFGWRQGFIDAPGTTKATIQTQMATLIANVQSPILAVSGDIFNLPQKKVLAGDTVRIIHPRFNEDRGLKIKVKRHQFNNIGEIVHVQFENALETLTGGLARQFSRGQPVQTFDTDTPQDGSSGSSGTTGTSGSAGTSGTAGTSGSSGTSGESPDYAELIIMRYDERDPEPGDVLIIDPDHDWQLTLTTKPGDTRVAGVYSTTPGFLANSRLVNGKPVALVGVCPCWFLLSVATCFKPQHWKDMQRKHLIRRLVRFLEKR